MGSWEMMYPHVKLQGTMMGCNSEAPPFMWLHHSLVYPWHRARWPCVDRVRRIADSARYRAPTYLNFSNQSLVSRQSPSNEDSGLGNPLPYIVLPGP